MSDPFSGMAFRTGVVRDVETAWLLAFDPKLEAEEEYFTFISKWTSGTFGPARKNFNAHTCCVASIPNLALILLAGDGDYGFVSPAVQVSGNVYEEGRPRPVGSRYGDLRWVAEVGGRAYAVGHMGTVYRLDAPKRWTRIDEDLPRTFDIEAIDGFGEKELYAVGKRGEVRLSDGHRWSAREMPSNVHLSRVECAGNGEVYIGGHRGLLIRGRNRSWSVIEHQSTTDDIWSLEWFNEELYVATMNALFRLRKDALDPVNFGKETPRTFYHLSAAERVMWSIGEEDVMSFDGTKWSRVV